MTAVAYRGVVKRFPGVVALDGVSFDIAPGSCHALCGENGAGKSTLGKVLAGVFPPDAGSVVIGGVERRFASPRDAIAAGVRLVHQEFAFCERLTVAENLLLGRLPHRRGFVDRPAMEEAGALALAEIASPIDVRLRVERLSPGERQMVQIAGAISGGARVIVFDEPTSSLSEGEARRLMALIRRLTARGVTCVYVSHRLHEVLVVADAVTVLRDGRHVATQPAEGLTEQRIASMMTGEPGTTVRTRWGDAGAPPSTVPADRPVLRLEVVDLASPGRFEGVRFTVQAGEVVGLAGLVGAGRTEVLRALFGLDPRATGRVLVEGRRATIASPTDAIRLGIGLVPEDRKLEGLVLAMTASANAMLAALRTVARLGWVRRGQERAVTRGLFDALDVRGPVGRAPVAALSGGNQQKVVLARWLAAGSRVLLLDEPTRGVDVGAKAELHGLIRQLLGRGVAVVLVSSELPELLALADRVLVMRAGQVVGQVARRDASVELVLAMMLGTEASDHVA